MAAEAHEQVQVALITGGADGMGLAIAHALAARGGWRIHILDTKDDAAGRKAVALLGGEAHAVFHRVDIRDYEQLAAAFRNVFLEGGRRQLDVVFANAGVFEKTIHYEIKSEDDEPPPPPDFYAVDVNIKGTINTVHLARHYIARSAQRGGSIVVTGSCSSVWPTYWAPVYTTSKFGILGFVRAIAGHFKVTDDIRVNVLCPGAMRTAIVPAEAWAPFPEETFVPLDRIAEVALKLAQGVPFVDAKGVEVPEGAYGQAVIASGRNFYWYAEPEHCDEIMKATMEGTRVDKH